MIENIGTIGKIIITKNLKRQIDYLHKKVGSTEWSGMLIYKHIKGSIKNMNNLVFKTNDLYLMDIGTGGNTKFEYTGDDVISMYDDIPEAIELSTALIHSHHNMGAFHSGTDLKELENNSDKYNYYISLVVDFKETYKCKIGFPSKTIQKNSNWIKNDEGKLVKNIRTIEQNIILIGDLDVEVQDDRNPVSWFTERYNKIVDKQKSYNLNSTNINNRYFPNEDGHGLNSWKGWDNSQQEMQFPEFNNDIKSEQFLKAILTLDSNTTRDLKICLTSFKEMINSDSYFNMLYPQLEILYTNIYGNNNIDFLDNHLNDVISQLEMVENKNGNILRLIKILTEYLIDDNDE